MRQVDDIRREADKVSRELHSADCRIASLTRWQQPEPGSINDQVLGGLERKRERLALALIDLQAQLPASPSRHDTPTSTDIRFKPREWMPIGAVAAADSALDIPAFLRRVQS